MKIEVTFDRSAKQKFRDDCVKRLRNFVEEMKGQTNSWQAQSVPLVNTWKDRSDRDVKVSVVDRTSNPPCSKEKHQKASSNAKGQEPAETMPNSSKQINRLAKYTSSRFEDRCGHGQERGSKEGEFVTMEEMRDNVDRIMSKIQHNSRRDSFQHQELKKQVNETNRKIDRLIVRFEERSDLDEIKTSHIFRKVSELETEVQLEEELLPASSEFELKFNHLTDRYSRVGTSSCVPNSGYVPPGSKGRHSFSMQSTGDSMTFRGS